MSKSNNEAELNKQEATDADVTAAENVEEQESTTIDTVNESDSHNEELAVENTSEDSDLVAKLHEAETQLAQLKDNFLRAKAESENIQRRSQNEVANARKFAIEAFAKELLSVKDSLDQAEKVEFNEGDDSNISDTIDKMHEGLSLTTKQFDVVIQKFGVQEVEAAPGVKFNPEVHQAISMVPGSEIESGHIIDVMQKGFTLNERLLRPAMVVVAQ